MHMVLLKMCTDQCRFAPSKKFISKRSYDKMLIDWLGQAGHENIWLSVRTHGPHCARSVHPDLKPNIFLSCPPTQSGQ